MDYLKRSDINGKNSWQRVMISILKKSKHHRFSEEEIGVLIRDIIKSFMEEVTSDLLIKDILVCMVMGRKYDLGRGTVSAKPESQGCVSSYHVRGKEGLTWTRGSGDDKRK